MMAKTLLWLVMVLLALAVAGYAAVVLLGPSLRPTFVRALFTDYPLATAAHFSGSALALAVGMFQVNASLRARYTGAHRWMGRLYVIGVAIGGVSGLFMGVQATGGVVAQSGFTLLAVLWLGFTFGAYYCIRVGKVAAHGRWMVRSLALTLGAVTLRIYVPASQLAEIPFMVAYPIIAWLAWVPNLVVAELYIRFGFHALPRDSFGATLQRAAS